MILCYAFRGLKRFTNFKGKNGMQKKKNAEQKNSNQTHFKRWKTIFSMISDPDVF